MPSTSTNQINSYGVGSSTANSSKGKVKKSGVDMTTFLTLLAKQMSSQDPMNPTDNTQMISEMAQFTSLQAMNSLADLSKQQYGASLVGKRVSVATFNKVGKFVSDSGIVTNCDYSAEDGPNVVVNGATYKLSEIMEVYSDANTSSFQYGASLVGKNVTVSAKDSSGKSVEDTGVVSGCSFSSGNVKITLNGKDYDLSAITKINTGSAAPASPSGTTTPTASEQTSSGTGSPAAS